MGRTFVFLPVIAYIALSIGVTHAYFVANGKQDPNQAQTPSDGVPVVYDEQSIYSQQYDPQQQQYLQVQPQVLTQQQQQQLPQLLQTAILAGRMGRSYDSDMPKSRAEEESGYREADQEYQEDDHEPIKKKKKKEEDSLPRRLIKKTRNAIVNTSKAVIGAPKYIYTRYKEAYGFGGSDKKKKSKGKGSEKGWGWGESGYEEHSPHDDHGDHNDRWGWDSRRSGSAVDEYERKTGKRSPPATPEYNYKYNKYLYKQPGSSSSRQDRQLSYNSWTG